MWANGAPPRRFRQKRGFARLQTAPLPPKAEVKGAILLATTIFALNGLLAVLLVCLVGKKQVLWAAPRPPEFLSDQVVDLGEFRCVSSMKSQNVQGTRFVEFGASAIIHSTRARAIAFEHILEQHDGRLRQLIQTAIRRTTVEELSDPQLAGVRARIHHEVHSLFPAMDLREIVFRHWRTFEIAPGHSGLSLRLNPERSQLNRR